MARRLRGLDTTALLGLTGTVVAALLSAGFIGDFLVNPAVYVELKNNTASKPMMLVTNDGSHPAHNLSLFIQAPSDFIINITNTFSTTNVSLVEPDSKILPIGRPVQILDDFVQISTPILSSGIGSKLEIETLLDVLHSQSGGISVTAVYDEGSTVGSIDPSLVRQMSIITSEHNFYLALTGYAAVAIGYVTFDFWIERRKRQRSIKELITRLENWRRNLEDDLSIPDRINLYERDESEDPRDSSTRQLWKRRHTRVRKIMKNPKDYIIIDDLNSKLENRNKKIENELEAIINTSPEEYRYEVKKIEY